MAPLLIARPAKRFAPRAKAKQKAHNVFHQKHFAQKLASQGDVKILHELQGIVSLLQQYQNNHLQNISQDMFSTLNI